MLTGIGHERDSTVLDEVANQRYDTPSKVIAGIERTIVQRTREAQSLFEQVSLQAHRSLERARQSVEQTHVAIQSGAHQSLADARAEATAMLGEVKLSAAYAIRSASDSIQRHMADVRHLAHRQIAQAQREVPALLADIRSEARQVLRTAQVQANADWRFVVEHTSTELRHQKEAVERVYAETTSRAHQTISDARERSQALVREITGQGPEKTLGRGFALVRDAEGRAVTSVISDSPELVIQFRDGERSARFTTGTAPETMAMPTTPAGSGAGSGGFWTPKRTGIHRPGQSDARGWQGAPPPWPVDAVRKNFAKATTKFISEQRHRYGVTGHITPHHHGVVAKTEFSTWEFMLDHEFMGNGLTSRLGTVFAGAWPSTQASHLLTHASDLVSTIRDFRNRLFHHEPAWKRFGVLTEADALQHLQEKINKIESLVALIHPENLKLLDCNGLLDTARRACTSHENRRFQHLTLTHKVNSLNKLRDLVDRCGADNSVLAAKLYLGRQRVFLISPRS